MAQYDPQTGKVKPTWTVRFSPWITMAGSLIGGAVAGLVVGTQIFLGHEALDISSAEALKTAVLFLGGAIAVFALLGPALGWGVGFALRNVENQWLHVLAFAVLGLIVGKLVGDSIGVWLFEVRIGSGIAPLVGLGAAVGRASISRFAKI